MPSPTRPDEENQRASRISWAEDERSPSLLLPVIRRFRGSRIARRIILYNLISLSVLMLMFVALTQYEASSIRQEEQVLGITTDLLEHQVQTGADVSNARGFEVRLYRDGRYDVLHSAGVFLRPDAFILDSLRSLVRFSGNAEPLELRSSFDMLLDTVAANPGLYPKRLSVQNGSLRNTVVAERREIAFGPNAGQILVVSSPLGLVEARAQLLRERLTQAFLASIALAMILSLILAYSLATPIHNLADAAERGHRDMESPGEANPIKIPNLYGRPDEIGRLSIAMRDMTNTLYNQIEHNQRFAADVTHEIKNPLASMSSAVQGLQNVRNDTERTRLETVLRQDVNRIDRLITDISQASKLDADLVRAERDSFDMGKLLEQIVSFHRLEANERGVTILHRAPSPDLFYIGVEQRLAQVFSNILSNAVTICDAGDTVTIWSFQTETNFFIMVEDTGPGIPEDNLDDIFDRFYSNRSEGTFGRNSGLGLAISRQIVAAHFGKIWAENVYDNDDPTGPRRGARFIVSLPRA
ncbi:MAG: ATP-binding protein [Pseudomonadota bacterium]